IDARSGATRPRELVGMVVVRELESNLESEVALSGTLPVSYLVQGHCLGAATEHLPKKRETNRVQQGCLATHVLAINNRDAVAGRERNLLVSLEGSEVVKMQGLNLKQR